MDKLLGKVYHFARGAFNYVQYDAYYWLGRNNRMSAETQLTLEGIVCGLLLVAATAAFIFAGSSKKVFHIPSVFIAAGVVAVGLVRWFVPGRVWPLLAYSRTNDDGSVLFLDSRWFFLIPLAAGAFAGLRWMHCQIISKNRPNTYQAAAVDAGRARRFQFGRAGPGRTELGVRLHRAAKKVHYEPNQAIACLIGCCCYPWGMRHCAAARVGGPNF